MTAKQDLIAAALTLADTHPGDIGGIYHAQKDLREMCARAMVQPDGWQPIETAPKHLSILLYCPRGGVVRGAWADEKFAKNPKPYWRHDRTYLFGIRETRDDQPTHWMPLLGAPK